MEKNSFLFCFLLKKGVHTSENYHIRHIRDNDNGSIGTCNHLIKNQCLVFYSSKFLFRKNGMIAIHPLARTDPIIDKIVYHPRKVNNEAKIQLRKTKYGSPISFFNHQNIKKYKIIIFGYPHFERKT